MCVAYISGENCCRFDLEFYGLSFPGLELIGRHPIGSVSNLAGVNGTRAII
jgi:hypothetical protein